MRKDYDEIKLMCGGKVAFVYFSKLTVFNMIWRKGMIFNDDQSRVIRY